MNSLPLNHSTKLSSSCIAGKIEKEDKSLKTEQGEGCAFLCVCVHLLGDITGDACSNGVSLSACRRNNIPETADQTDLMPFSVCWLHFQTD